MSCISRQVVATDGPIRHSTATGASIQQRTQHSPQVLVPHDLNHHIPDECRFVQIPLDHSCRAMTRGFIGAS